MAVTKVAHLANNEGQGHTRYLLTNLMKELQALLPAEREFASECYSAGSSNGFVWLLSFGRSLVPIAPRR